MKKHFFYPLMAAVSAFSLCFCMTACGSDDKSELEELEEDINDGVSVIKVCIKSTCPSVVTPLVGT